MSKRANVKPYVRKSLAECARPCAYCKKNRAANFDHVVPKSYRKKGAIHPLLSGTVPACFRCNMLKGTRRLIPESWADRLTLLSDEYPGTPWRVWHGSTKEPAYSEVHV